MNENAGRERAAGEAATCPLGFVRCGCRPGACDAAAEIESRGREIAELVGLLRALARYEHHDLSLGDAAANELEELWRSVRFLYAGRAAKWRAGTPTNLEAAAADALVWLRWLDRAQVVGATDAPALSRCVAALERFMSNAQPPRDV